jgi:hypothetical protein
MFKQKLLLSHIPTEGQQVVVVYGKNSPPYVNGKESEMQTGVIKRNVYQWRIVIFEAKKLDFSCPFSDAGF